GRAARRSIGHRAGPARVLPRPSRATQSAGARGIQNGPAEDDGRKGPPPCPRRAEWRLIYLTGVASGLPFSTMKLGTMRAVVEPAFFAPWTVPAGIRNA